MEDDFDGSALNASLWQPKHNASHCSPCEPQLYLSENVGVGDGVLTLTTKREVGTVGPGGEAYNYTSGWVDTRHRFSQFQGRFEVTAKLPRADCWGAWPAHWLLPDDESVCWPAGGEVDIMEGAMNEAYNPIAATYHWSDGGACGADEHPLFGGLYPPVTDARPADEVDWASAFHTFVVEWSDADLKYFVDEHQVYSVAEDPRAGTKAVLPPGEMYVSKVAFLKTRARANIYHHTPWTCAK
jgi:beta-glucanase (GH16 family)